MAVGTDPITCYEQENVSWLFTLTDSTGNITNISGQAIQLSIRVTPDSALLLGPITCSIASASNPMTFLAEFLLNLDIGTYKVGIRRTDSGFKWQYVHAPLTVLGSVNVD